MAKRSLPVFPGNLNEPIVKGRMFPFGHVPGNTDTERKNAYDRRLAELRSAKFIELLKHYNIAASEKDRWSILAGRLALDCVPGMQVFERLPRRARPREKWGLELSFRLCDEIDAIRAERPRPRIRKAIEIAQERCPNDWGKYKVSTLETRYHELKAAQRARGAMHPVGMLSNLFPSNDT
jgi:hypothetical protein